MIVIVNRTLFTSWKPPLELGPLTAEECERDAAWLHAEVRRNREGMTRFCFEPLLASTLMIGEPFSLSARRTPPDERDIIWLYETPKIPPLMSAEEFERATTRELARFKIARFGEIKPDSTAQYLVKGLLQLIGLAVVWGPPKCGKSFWTFDLLMHVALGRPYRGHRVSAGSVVYCALEGVQGFKNRIEAFRQAKIADDSDPPFYLMATPLSLVRDQKAFIADIAKQLDGQKPVAVCIDTLNRSLDGSESSDEDMTAYVRAADAIRDDFGCLVVVVHHCGHNGDRPRGHSSLMGALDVQIAVRRDVTDNIVAELELSKDGETGLQFVFRLKAVAIGADQDGDPITSCVVSEKDDAAFGVSTRRQRQKVGRRFEAQSRHRRRLRAAYRRGRENGRVRRPSS